jgi:hypothetical protein
MSEPLNKLILDKVWMCLSNQPDHCKNAYFNQFLKSSSVVEEIATESKIKSASSLPAYMNGPKPDNIDYFKTLPTECGTDWCCYAAILEKPGCKPRVQIGSGTHGTFGGQRRLDDYPNERALPSLVLKALNEGFVITHVGVLCTASKPEAADQPLTRLVFVAIEGTFAYLFWSLNAYKADYGMGFTCLWDWQGLPWDSLSTHSPFYEGIRSEFGLTEEQMQDHLAKLEIKHKQSRARINSNSHYRRMEENYHECMDATMQQVKEWRAANPERKLENDRALRKKVLDEKRNLCSDCKCPFRPLPTWRSTRSHCTMSVWSVVTSQSSARCAPEDLSVRRTWLSTSSLSVTRRLSLVSTPLILMISTTLTRLCLTASTLDCLDSVQPTEASFVV